METEATKNPYDKVLHDFLLLMYDNDSSFRRSVFMTLYN